MCISDPVRIVETIPEGDEALVELRGARRLISVALLRLDGQSVEPGDWVLAAAGIATEKIDEEEAMGLRDLMQAARGEGPRT